MFYIPNIHLLKGKHSNPEMKSTVERCTKAQLKTDEQPTSYVSKWGRWHQDMSPDLTLWPC